MSCVRFAIVSAVFVSMLNPTLCQSVAPGNELTCLAMVCNFESGNLCNYQNIESDEISSRGAWKKFSVYTRAFRNLATGVRFPVEGSAFASTYLKPGDKAMIESQGTINSDGVHFVFPLLSDRVVRFRVYKVADQMELKGCCDTINNCPFSTDKDVKITDFSKWKTESFVCKAGTQKIIFYGINSGLNEGAIGLDDIQLYLPSYSTPDKADSNACFKATENAGGSFPTVVNPIPNQIVLGTGQTISLESSGSNNNQPNPWASSGQTNSQVSSGNSNGQPDSQGSSRNSNNQPNAWRNSGQANSQGTSGNSNGQPNAWSTSEQTDSLGSSGNNNKQPNARGTSGQSKSHGSSGNSNQPNGWGSSVQRIPQLGQTNPQMSSINNNGQSNSQGSSENSNSNNNNNAEITGRSWMGPMAPVGGGDIAANTNSNNRSAGQNRNLPNDGTTGNNQSNSRNSVA